MYPNSPTASESGADNLTSRSKGTAALAPPGSPISRQSYRTLRPAASVDSEIIDALGNRLRSPAVEVYPTHFQQQLTSEIFIGSDLVPLQRDCKVSLWPIHTGNTKNGHWTLIALDHAALELSLYDSDYTPNSTCQKEQDGSMRVRVGSPASWLLVIHDWIISKRSDFDGKLMVIDRSSTTPRQAMGTNDCGAYVALFLTCLAEGQQPWTPLLDPQPHSTRSQSQPRASAHALPAGVDVAANVGYWRMRLALLLLDPNSTWGPGTEYPGYRPPPRAPTAALWDTLGLAYPFPTKAISCPALPSMEQVTAAYRNTSLRHRPDRTADRAAPEGGTHETSTTQLIDAAYDAIKDWYQRHERAVGARIDPHPRRHGAARVCATPARRRRLLEPPSRRPALTVPPRHHFADALRSAPTAHNHAYTPRWTNSLIPSVVWCDWCPQHSAPMTPAWSDLGTPSAQRGGLTLRVAPRRESPRAAPPRHHFADALRSAPTAHNHAYTPRRTNSLIPSVVWCDWHPQHSAAMPPSRPVLGTLLAPRGGLTPRMAPRRLRKLDVRRRTTAAGP